MSVTIPKPTITGTVTKTINTVIADDHKIFREGLKYMIGRDQSLHVLGEAKNGFELMEQAKQFQPEVVITDIRMPEMDGLQACKMLKKKYPAMKVKNPARSKNMTMNTYATGEAKYAVSSRFVIVLTLEKALFIASLPWS